MLDSRVLMIGSGVPAPAQTPSQPKRTKSNARFFQRRNLRQCLEPLRTGRGENLELLGLILRHDRQASARVDIDTSGDQFLHHLAAAAKRNAVHRDAGELLQLARHDLLRRAGADGRVGDFAGMGLGVGDERFEVVGRDRIRQREAVVVFGDQRDWREIAELDSRDCDTPRYWSASKWVHSSSV